MGYYKECLYQNAITWTTDGANAGYTRFRKGDFYCTNVCGVLINDKGMANEFIAEQINSISKYHVSYVGNPKLMNNVMAEIQIFFPCIEEQKIISSFINELNNEIELNEQILDDIQRMKEAFLQRLFI